jgi:pimeloyl-ACP methyl ester carboxylesterase
LKIFWPAFIWIFFLNLWGPSQAYAQSNLPALPTECRVISPQAANRVGLQPQWIIVCVPQDWNGELVVYAHGYRPPQIPVESPENLALLIEELTFDGQIMPAALLSWHYAFAITTSRKNGYNVEQGSDDLNLLVQYFKVCVAPLTKPHAVETVFVAGISEGGLIATMLVERYPKIYDGGALVLCGPVGGAALQIQYLSDFRVVFDYFFPQVFKKPPDGSGLPAFGAFDVPPQAFRIWDTICVPAITAAVTSNPSAADQLFKVTRVARDSQNSVSSAVTATLDVLYYNIWGTPDLISTAGGIPYDNRFRTYWGSANDAALNKGVERVSSTGSAFQYVNQFYRTTGKLERPLVTLHTTGDPIVPFSHERIYAGRVTFAGPLSFLTSLPISKYGHGNFTAQEVLKAFGLHPGPSSSQSWCGCWWSGEDKASCVYPDSQ